MTAAAEYCATLLVAAYKRYRSTFLAITAKAKHRFETRDWNGVRQDVLRRTALYDTEIDLCLTQLKDQLGVQIGSDACWADMEKVYEARVAGYATTPMAMTFFDSVKRKIADITEGQSVHPFVDPDIVPPVKFPAVRSYRGTRTREIRALLQDYDFTIPFAAKEDDVRWIGFKLDQFLSAYTTQAPPVIEMLTTPFFRDWTAFLVGRVVVGQKIWPLVLAVVHKPKGLVVEAFLWESDSVSILFSFTRAAFFVKTHHPDRIVAFIKTVLPEKPASELYSALGFPTHGKSLLLYEMRHQLNKNSIRFEIAPGRQGMVMAVIHTPAFDMVFKLIRDHFEYPKKTSRDAVHSRYDYVLRHNRAGRLVDAWPFNQLWLDRRLFSKTLLDQLEDLAGESLTISADKVVLHQVYVERRVTPLDLFVSQNDSTVIRHVVVDYGQAIKDLAHSNVFPGDMLLKNFGVTRLGRVVFYDYDELCRLTECRFLSDPDPDGSLANDVFPEEFRMTDGLPDPLRRLFHETHSDLFMVQFWENAQKRIMAGQWRPIAPYNDRQRLRPGS